MLAARCIFKNSSESKIQGIEGLEKPITFISQQPCLTDCYANYHINRKEILTSPATFTDMKAELTYVELKTGYNDNGPAWIGNGFYNRTRKTVYFNGQVFCRSQSVSGNHIDLETGEAYWISGIKKNGTDRHWAGAGTIEIDESVVDEYLRLRDLTGLRKGKYIIVKFDNEPAKEISKELENQRPDEGFDESLRFKEISNLTDLELNELIAYYEGLDLSSTHKKNRKGFIDKLNELIDTKEARQAKAAPNKKQALDNNQKK
jgi:hypothetical protein